MKNFVFKTSIPCVVKWKNEEEFLEDGVSLCFDSPKRLYVFPVTGRREDTSFVLDMAKPSSRIKVIDTSEAKIFYLQKNSCDSIRAKQSLVVDGKTINFEIGTHNLKVDDGQIVKTIEIEKPKTYSLFSIESHALLKIKSTSVEELIDYNTLSHSLEKICASQITIEGSEILCETNSLQEKYAIIENKLVKVKSNPSSSRNPLVTGMLFLQKLKNKQRKEACLMVAESLEATEEKLEEFFGDFDDFFPLSQNTYVLIKKSGHEVVQLDLTENLVSSIKMLD